MMISTMRLLEAGVLQYYPRYAARFAMEPCLNHDAWILHNKRRGARRIRRMLRRAQTRRAPLFGSKALFLTVDDV